MQTRSLIVVFVIACAYTAAAQVHSSSSHVEQHVFGLEQPIDRPVPIPDEVLKILRHNSEVSACDLGSASLDSIPADWYAASEIHLGDPKKSDLVVKAKNVCLFGPNIGPFWVFRRTTESYRLVLSAQAMALKILSSKTKGLRDISTQTMIGVRPSFERYKFDGRAYQPD